MPPPPSRPSGSRAGKRWVAPSGTLRKLVPSGSASHGNGTGSGSRHHARQTARRRTRSPRVGSRRARGAGAPAGGPPSRAMAIPCRRPPSCKQKFFRRRRHGGDAVEICTPPPPRPWAPTGLGPGACRRHAAGGVESSRTLSQTRTAGKVDPSRINSELETPFALPFAPTIQLLIKILVLRFCGCGYNIC
jgi:hypothetical protein